MTTSQRSMVSAGSIILVACACICNAAAPRNSVTFDNQSGQPALVKLIGPTPREVTVPEGERRTVTASAGRHYIKTRYGTPGHYRYSKGDEFDITETATTRSEITITLHKVVDGNYDSEPISESEFLANKPSTGKRTLSAQHLAGRIKATQEKTNEIGGNAVPVCLDEKGGLLVLGEGTKFKAQLGGLLFGTLTVTSSEFRLGSPSDLRHNDGDVIFNVGEGRITLSGLSLDTGEFAVSKNGQLEKQKGALRFSPEKTPTDARPVRDSTSAEWVERPDIVWNGRLSIPNPIKFTYAERNGKHRCDGWEGDPPPAGEVTASGSLTDADGATVAVFQKEPVKLIKRERVFFECESGDWRLHVYPEITGATITVFGRRDRPTATEKADQLKSRFPVSDNEIEAARHLLGELQQSKSSVDKKGTELTEGQWKELPDVTFKGKLDHSSPLKGKILDGKIKYDEGQDVKITATGSLIRKDSTTLKSFNNIPVLLRQEEYDFFQFDIDHWRVLLHTELKGMRTENVVKVFVADNANLPDRDRRVPPFTVADPKGGSVLAADERTREFLEKAFKAGFLLPDPRLPGNVTFDMQAFMSSDGDRIIKQYFPSGKLQMKDVDDSSERVVLSLASGPLKTEQSEDNRKGSAETLLARAEMLSLQGSSEEAYAAFEEVLSLSVDAETKVRAIVGMARLLDGDGRSQEAQDLYLKASKLSTNPNTQAMILIGQSAALLQERRLAEARASVERASRLATDPQTKATAMMTSSALDVLEGNVEKGRKRFSDAGELIETAIREAQDNEKKAHLKLVLATIFMAQNRWNDVRTTMDEAFDLTEKVETKCMILQFQGGIFSSRKQTARARQSFEQALKVAPTPDHVARCFTGLGEVSQYEGKPSEALANYDKALAKATSKEARSQALFKKGTVLLEQGSSQEAISSFEEVIRLTRSVHRKARSLANIGSALARQGKLTEAQAKLEEALSFPLRPSVKKQIEHLLQEVERATAR